MALAIAVETNQDYMVQILLEAGASANVDLDGTPILNIAVQNDLEGIVRHLVEAGGNVHVECNGSLLLNIATLNQNKEIVEILLKAGVDANKTSDKGRFFSPALHIAITAKDQSIVELLLK
ncbi:NF-kappa-B inhibitor delta-like [Belonocnema kinseyi]|uniref:NF-kappa-B inhibitor delta-like n=1 Tax=Belonocnema kinseyi TaxID=2817044 RepID=UPI00143DAB6C|nr:NF-kappa-B inhibitor delta-like [Belonocnema kinseyi]